MAESWDDTAKRIGARLGTRGATLRNKVREYVEHCVRDGYDITPTVAALHEHSELDREPGAHFAAGHEVTVGALTHDSLRVLAGVSAAAYAACGWEVQDVTKEAIEDGHPIVGAIVGRLLHAAPIGPTDAATMDRLIETLTADERMLMVCNTAASLGALGFTQAGIAELGNALGTVANAAPQDITPDMVDRAMDEVLSALQDMVKPETD